MKHQVPLSVPPFRKGEYLENWRLATKGTNHLMLFAGDQKIEHLNNDFWGPKISLDDANPEHLFRIAANSESGIFAAQLGLIATYGMSYRKVPYLVKLNSKSDLVGLDQAEPYSSTLNSVEEVVEFKKNSKLKIVGVGYTIYPGSEHEAKMLQEAAHAIYTAHKHGLIAVIWAYPRGKAVTNEKDVHLIAGCAGIAACLGADFVKVNYPNSSTKGKSPDITEVIQAAGRTGVVFSGGASTDAKTFLKGLAEQIKQGAAGNATGRNIHQYSHDEAIRMANAIAMISLYNWSATDAHKVFTGNKTPRKQPFIRFK